MKEDLLPIMGEDRMIQEATRTIYRKNMEKEIIREIDVQSVMTESVK
jgi:transcription initiation factor TFIIIB Brf1 subunit/transcription initiation factor TFIIB